MPDTVQNNCYALSFGAYRNANVQADPRLSKRLQHLQAKELHPRLILHGVNKESRDALIGYLNDNGFTQAKPFSEEVPLTYRQNSEGLMLNLTPEAIEPFVAGMTEKIGARLIDRKSYVEDFRNGNDSAIREGMTAKAIAEGAAREIQETKEIIRAR